MDGDSSVDCYEKCKSGQDIELPGIHPVSDCFWDVLYCRTNRPVDKSSHDNDEVPKTRGNMDQTSTDPNEVANIRFTRLNLNYRFLVRV